MNDFTRVNAPRVEKLVAAIELIHKSARSNRVDPTELLKPALDALQPQLPPGVVLDTPTKSKRRDITLWEEAKTAPLDELMMAYTTITSRLVDLVDEGKNK